MVMCDGLLVPNIHRTLVKVAAFRAKDYQHFAQYQESLRDAIRLWGVLGEHYVLMACCDLKGCSYEEAMMVLDAIKSWSHISEQQWLAFTSIVVEEVYQPHLVNDELSVLQ